MEPSGNALPKAGGARWFDMGGVTGLAARPVALVITVILVILLGATIALWMHYGTAVFYEMIVAGLAACL